MLRVITLAGEKLIRHKKEQGFTLIEVAVVLVIIGLLLSGLMMPLVARKEMQRQETTKAQLSEVVDALMGYATIAGRLPCPATAASAGLAAPNAASTTCTQSHGFIPGRTLGLRGSIDGNGVLIDAWDNPIRYSLTTSDTGAFSNDITIGLSPDFRVCEQSACSSVIADNVVAVVFSMGNDGATGTTSADQLENTDGDISFVQRTLSEQAGSEFDDLLEWVSLYTLTLNMVKSGQLD